jgi:hypothetical protein
MTTRLAEMVEAVEIVRRETSVWVRHLTGEGHATVRRNRQAAVAELRSQDSTPVEVFSERGRSLSLDQPGRWAGAGLRP